MWSVQSSNYMAHFESSCSHEDEKIHIDLRSVTIWGRSAQKLEKREVPEGQAHSWWRRIFTIIFSLHLFLNITEIYFCHADDLWWHLNPLEFIFFKFFPWFFNNGKAWKEFPFLVLFRRRRFVCGKIKRTFWQQNLIGKGNHRVSLLNRQKIVAWLKNSSKWFEQKRNPYVEIFKRIV